MSANRPYRVSVDRPAPRVGYADSFDQATRLADAFQAEAYEGGYGLAEYGHRAYPTATIADDDRRPCYCIQLFADHLVGEVGCAFNPDWSSRD